jgi:hypothetical protein
LFEGGGESFHRCELPNLEEIVGGWSGGDAPLQAYTKAGGRSSVETLEQDNNWELL